MIKYTCVYCRAEFSREWDRDRHAKHIHRNHQNQGYQPRILACNKFETIGPQSIESNQNIRSTSNVRNSYQKKAKYRNTGIIGDNNGVKDYVDWNAIYSYFRSKSDINRDDEKIEHLRLFTSNSTKIMDA